MGPVGPPPPPPAAPRSRRRGRLVALVAGLVVVALALAGAGVWAFRTFTGRSSGVVSSRPIADILTEPHRLWQWSPQAGEGEQHYVSSGGGVEVAGGKTIVLTTSFDYSSWFSAGGYDAGWFPGYDRQYDAGYQQGVAYAKALRAYSDDWFSNPWPDPAEFMPAGLTLDELYQDANRGYGDGFNDGTIESRGSTRLKAPPTVQFVPSVVGLSTDDGSARWSHSLSDDVHLDIATAMPATVFPVPGTADVGFYANVPSDGSGPSRGTVALLSAADGTKVASRTLDDQVFGVVAFDGTVFVTHGDGKGDITVTALRVADLGGNPVWEKPVGAAGLCEVAPGVLAVDGYGQGAVRADGTPTCDVTGADHFFSASDGTTWQTLETGADVSYRPVGTGFLKLKGQIGGEDGLVSDGSAMFVDADGKDVWKHPVRFGRQATVVVVDGVILSGDMTTDKARWVRLDPKSGDEAWDGTFAVGTPLAVHRDLVVAQDGRSVVWYDLRTGKETFDARVTDDAWYLVGEGDKNLYLASSTEMRAFSPDDQAETWSHARDGSGFVFRSGSHVYVSGASFERMG